MPAWRTERKNYRDSKEKIKCKIIKTTTHTRINKHEHTHAHKDTHIHTYYPKQQSTYNMSTNGRKKNLKCIDKRENYYSREC